MSSFSDIDINLTKQTDGDILKDEDVEAIKNSLLNIVTTIPGSRRMLPLFASGIHNLLFEPMDEITASRIGNYLVENILAWDNRINIQNLNINVNYDKQQYEATLKFSVINTNKNNTLNFILTPQ